MADEVELDEWGGIVQRRPGEAEQADLGRATDLSFLGEAAQDPVGAGQEAALELQRTGTLGGVSLEEARAAARGVSEFPMERGTSRASRELPELFMGKVEMDPRFEELNATLSDPEASTWAKMGAMMEMREREEMMVSPTIRVGSGVLAGMPAKELAMVTAAAMTMHDPQEVAMMLTQPDPDDPTKQRWPQFSVTQAPDGVLVINNTDNGRQAIVNRPGWSAHDAAQLGVGAAMFTPAGRLTGAMASTAGRMAVGAATAGATEAAIQYGQEAAGGEFDKLDVALSAGIGPAIDLARPLMGGAYRFTRFLGSYIPENFFGVQTAWQGLNSVLGPTRQRLLSFVDHSKEFLQSGRQAILTTQDAVPEAHAPWRHLLLKVVERMPLTGTGGMREAQKQERVEVLRWLADKFDLNVNTNYGHQVVESLNRNAGARLSAARQGIDTAVDELADQDIILRDFRLAIKDMIDNEKQYGDLGNQGVINLLNKVRNRIWQGVDTPPGQTFPRDFGTMNDWLEYLYRQSADAPPNAKAALNDVADALRRDLARHAGEEGGEAGARWLRATQQLDDLIRGEETNTLRTLIEAGEVDEQVIRKVMQNGDEDLMRVMMDNLAPEGVNSARSQFLKEGLWRSGWRTGPTGEMKPTTVDAARFLKYLDDNSKTFSHLWPEGTDRQLLDGMREYLRLTAAAQQTGKGIGMAAAAQTGFGAGLNLATLGVAGMLGHAYQSAPIRNMLLRLSEVKSDPRLKDAVMMELSPLLMSAGREMAQHWQDSDPHDTVYVSDLLGQYYDDQAAVEQDRANMMEAAGARVDPGTMDALRTAAGADEEEGPGIGARLLQMLGMGDEEEAPQE